MKVAIVHYHLGHGGVSEVIAAASRMLTASGIPHVILAGPSSVPDLPLCVIEELGYAETADPDDLLMRLRSAALAKLGGPPDIWHFHNHSLGKNPAIPKMVARLASEGERLLLQIHDLAEDGRPENAARLTDRGNLYPVGPRLHYAFLNSRDRGRFITAGLPKSSAHLLPNPIENRPICPAPPGDPLLLYPVRGIRRKNLGELLLLAALAPQGTRLAITRAPLNQEARMIHDSWRRFSEEMRLPVEFDVVDRIEPVENAGSTFETWIAKATHLVTTSVSEGFGMVFPESIARGRPLLGRMLPHLARDHAALGIHSGRFYDRILLPREWINEAVYKEIQRGSMDGLWSAWDRQSPSVGPDCGPIDFGNLPEVLQQRAILKLMEPGMKLLPKVETAGPPRPAVEWLAEVLALREPDAVNGRPSPFPPERYQNKLTGIYSQLMGEATGPAGSLDPDRILDAYLTLESFNFLTSPAAIRKSQPDFKAFRAIIFDVYGTLLAAPSGGVKPDPAADELLHGILSRHGHAPPMSASTELHVAVRRYHASAGCRHPEVDLRMLWREVLNLPPDADVTELVMEIEAAWHPARMIEGVEEALNHLSAGGIALGLLSNAQCNTLPSLGGCAVLFQPDLTILSYEHRLAKPSPELFDLLATRLGKHDISPAETLYIGNDPLHDIEPAAACGFRTALFTGDEGSRRAGFCFPDFEIATWSELAGK